MHAIVDGERVRSMRQAMSMSMKELSELARISESTLRRIESGGYRAHFGTVRKLASTLEVSPWRLACPAALPTFTLIRGGASRVEREFVA